MGDFIKGLFGGNKPAASPVSDADADADFADFPSTADPSPASIIPDPASAAASASDTPYVFRPAGGFSGLAGRPYTKWYRVWERTTPSDFYQEAIIIPFILLVVFIHLWGTRTNRRKANKWISTHAPVLGKEFAVVGFGGVRMPSLDEVQGDGLLKAGGSGGVVKPEELLREKRADEYITYATGRQNVAFLDVKLSFVKRYNPLQWLGENAVGFFFESLPPTTERMEATSYVFDGKEKDLVPQLGGKAADEIRETRSSGKSTFDGFVFAVVHKDLMKRLRDDRYDLSLTSTKDHPKLPIWSTVMSESAEVTETLLTPELIKAVEQAGDEFEALIVSDQPMEQPKKLDETVPRKRISLSLRLPSSDDYSHLVPIFTQFLQLPDYLVSKAHFRPEALRRIKQTRDEEIRKIRKVDEEEKAEERKLRLDKEKKEERDRKMRGMTAEEQRKFLERERVTENRRREKRRTMRG